MTFRVKVTERNVPDEELLEDVRSVAQRLNRNTVTIEEYNDHGR